MPNPKSTASIAGHPIHPMLVGFPIVFFVATFASDLIFWRTGVLFWAAASFWLANQLVEVPEPNIRLLISPSTRDGWNRRRLN